MPQAGAASLPVGAFVKVLFPTDERPREPGLPHIAYCLGSTATLGLVAYTTSQPWPEGVPLPAGVRVFVREEAAALNQRPFVLHLNRLAKLPLTVRWFPDLATPDRGIVAVAGPALRRELLTMSEELLRRRREAVRVSGPD